MVKINFENVMDIVAILCSNYVINLGHVNDTAIRIQIVWQHSFPHAFCIEHASLCIFAYKKKMLKKIVCRTSDHQSEECLDDVSSHEGNGYSPVIESEMNCQSVPMVLVNVSMRLQRDIILHVSSFKNKNIILIIFFKSFDCFPSR